MVEDILSEEFRNINKALKQEREKRLKELADAAWQKARLIASLLRERYGVGRVLLYGSLAWGGFREGSDIDIFVEGFKDQYPYWKMYVEMERLASPFEINLVLAEDASRSLRETVLKNGVVL